MSAAMEKDDVCAKPSPVAGNGLFAKKNVPAGELLFALERPLIAVLDGPSLAETCSYCFGATFASMYDPLHFELKACTGCKVNKYCSKKCQSRSWKREHKFECPILRDIGTERKLPNAVRALMQILLKKRSGQMPDEEWAAIMRMESHISGMKPEKRESVRVMSYGALKFSKAEDIISETVAEEILARILTNSLTLSSPSLDPLGVCLDPLACTANHSCEPNAVVVFDDAELSFRSLKPIQEDEEIFISYIDNTNPFAHRQAQLQDQFCFTCNCSKCQKRFSAREDQFEKNRNQINKKLCQQADIIAEQREVADDPANRVSDNTTPDVWERRLSALQGQGFDDVEQSRKLANGIFWEAALKKSEHGLHLLYGSEVWPITRQPYAALRDEMIVNVSACQRWPISWKHMVTRYFHIDPILYPEPHHPVRVIHTFMCSTQTLHMFTTHNHKQLDDLFNFPPDFHFGQIVYGLLKEVSDNVGKSHGEGSTFARFVRSRLTSMRADIPDGGKHWEETLPQQWSGLRNVVNKPDC